MPDDLKITYPRQISISVDVSTDLFIRLESARRRDSVSAIVRDLIEEGMQGYVGGHPHAAESLDAALLAAEQRHA